MARAKMFIVKVQISIRTTHAERRLLVYDETRTRMFEGEAAPNVTSVLGDRLKTFFWAEDGADGKLNLLEEAPWQTW